MNDQNQQQPGQAQSGTTQTSQDQTAQNSLANAPQNQPHNPWMEPSNEGQSGGDSGQTAATQQATQGNTGAGQAAEQGSQSATATAGTAQTQTPTQALSASDISDLVAKTVSATVTANQPKPQKQFTEEDFRRTFQVFEPTPEILASIGLPSTPESAQAFAKITAAIVRQAVTMSAYQLEKLKGEIEAHVKTSVQPYEPARQMAQERVEQKLKEEFLDANPDLKGYEPLLEEIKDRLISQGTKFKSKDDVFKTIGEHARSILKQIPGVGQANSQPAQQQSTNANGGGANHRMSGLSGSGQGGVGTSKGGTGGAAKKKSTAEQLFG